MFNKTKATLALGKLRFILHSFLLSVNEKPLRFFSPRLCPFQYSARNHLKSPVLPSQELFAILHVTILFFFFLSGFNKLSFVFLKSGISTWSFFSQIIGALHALHLQGKGTNREVLFKKFYILLSVLTQYVCWLFCNF